MIKQKWFNRSNSVLIPPWLTPSYVYVYLHKGRRRHLTHGFSADECEKRSLHNFSPLNTAFLAFTHGSNRYSVVPEWRERCANQCWSTLTDCVCVLNDLNCGQYWSVNCRPPTLTLWMSINHQSDHLLSSLKAQIKVTVTPLCKCRTEPEVKSDVYWGLYGFRSISDMSMCQWDWMKLSICAVDILLSQARQMERERIREGKVRRGEKNRERERERWQTEMDDPLVVAIFSENRRG